MGVSILNNLGYHLSTKVGQPYAHNFIKFGQGVGVWAMKLGQGVRVNNPHKLGPHVFSLCKLGQGKTWPQTRTRGKHGHKLGQGVPL